MTGEGGLMGRGVAFEFASTVETLWTAINQFEKKCDSICLSFGFKL